MDCQKVIATDAGSDCSASGLCLANGECEGAQACYLAKVQMPSRNVLIAGGLILVVALYFVLKKKPLVGPELAADQIVSKGQAAAEEGDIDEVMDLIADDFRAQVRGMGEINKSDLKGYLVKASLIGGGISVTIASQDIVIGEDLRSVEITLRALLVAGGIRGAIEEGAADAREIIINIELRDDEWLVVSASG